MKRFFVIITLLGLACNAPDTLPGPDSEAYEQALSAFYAGVASMQSGEDRGAAGNFITVTEQAPGEPSAFYNLGLLSARQNRLDDARSYLNQAALIAPEEPEIPLLQGLIASSLGESSEALSFFRKAVLLDAQHVKAGYAMVQELLRVGEQTLADEATTVLDGLLAQLPENRALLMERIRLAAQRQEDDVLQTRLFQLIAPPGGWPNDVQEPLDRLLEAATTGDMDTAVVQAGFLRNVLLSTFHFRQDLLQVQTPLEEIGEIMTRFIALPAPETQTDLADTGHTFSETSLPFPASHHLLRVATLNGDDPPAALSLDGQRLFIDGSPATGIELVANQAGPMVAIDYNYDFLNDLAWVEDGTVQLATQDSLGNWRVQSIYDSSTPVHSLWVADVDLEGDLDLVLGREAAPVIVLQNNGDGTFGEILLFDTMTAQDFVWADFDQDGDPDAIILNEEGGIAFYRNNRLGNFASIPLPDFADIAAISAADVDSDAQMDLLLLQQNGSILAVSEGPDGNWVSSELVSWGEAVDLEAAAAGLFVVDLDNNGNQDLIATSGEETRYWLSEGQGTFLEPSLLPDFVFIDVVDQNGDGLHDLAGRTRDEAPVLMAGQGTANYNWLILRPRAGQALGDQRINSFTLGGEIEVRSGLFYQKQRIQSPRVHFGLGTQETADVARIFWPNGDIQSEFELAGNQSVFTPQRLKGSCPWLFTFDGDEMRFVTDFIWRSPLGLRINAQETAGVMTTEDWVKIPGEALVPRDGYYDVRITAELWETHFFDHIRLLAVDHPEDTEVFVDERFAIPPPAMQVHALETLKPVQALWTDQGDDATAVITERDEQYLDFFGKGNYQGVTRPHSYEIELPLDTPRDLPVYLVAFGWVRPTDSSINVALGQGSHAPPQGIQLDVLDENGQWKRVHDNLGFPAGKTKTMLMDLTGALPETGTPRVRISTNLEIYWDQIAWSIKKETPSYDLQSLDAASVDLTYRGFSEIVQSSANAPEVPVYDTIVSTAPIWQDLEGFYTRFGDVKELVDQVDDRYVIMNAGDELRLLFPALDPPPDGMVRDFMLIGDGWVKDGDFNTVASKTIRPLPTHASSVYEEQVAGPLSSDPVYLKHPADWQHYHTRYITPTRMRNALVVR